MHLKRLIGAWTKPVLSVVTALVVVLSTSCEPPVVADYSMIKAVLKAKDYSVDRYFFLDNAYRRYYIKKYAPQSSAPVAPPKVKELSVWRLYNRTATDRKSNIKPVKVDTIDQLYLYEQLERDKHYFFDPAEGYIRFTDSISLQPEQQVAIFMRTEDMENRANASLQRGSFEIVPINDSVNGLAAGDTLWHLWTIRPREPIQSPEEDTSRFYLPWRHVYGPIDYSDPVSFKLSVRRLNMDSDERQEKFGSTFFADILGLTDNGLPKIQNWLIYNKQFNDLVLPPYDTSFYGLEPFNNPALGEYRDSLIYRKDIGGMYFIENQSLWEIETISRRYVTK